MNKYEEILIKLNLKDLFEYISYKKVVSISDIRRDVKDVSDEEILLDIGALECMGCVMIKYGSPIKFIAVSKQDIPDRFWKRFKL